MAESMTLEQAWAAYEEKRSEYRYASFAQLTNETSETTKCYKTARAALDAKVKQLAKAVGW